MRLVEIGTGRDVVAEEYLASVQVRDDQVQIVHQLDPGAGVSGRISPDQRHSQRHKLGVGAQFKVPGVPLARRDCPGGVLVENRSGHSTRRCWSTPREDCS